MVIDKVIHETALRVRIESSMKDVLLSQAAARGLNLSEHIRAILAAAIAEQY